MTTLILMRHGETDWNVEGRWQGQADPPLNERGRQQARGMAHELRARGMNALYSSDLSRALETAQIIAAPMGLAVIPVPQLREIHLGKAQGMLAADVQAEAPEQFRSWYESPRRAKPFGDEDLDALSARVLTAVNAIAGRHRGQRIGVVSHQLPLAVILCAWQGLELEHFRQMLIPNGSYREIVVTEPFKDKYTS